MNYTIPDYEDEDLIAELEERGYAVYKNKEIQTNITKLEWLDEHLKSKLKTLKQSR